MILNETAIKGTLKPDGTLELDQKPNLPAGRVTVVLRQEPDAVLPQGAPFWQRMDAMWAIPKTAGNAPDGGANTSEELQQMREEWHAHQRRLELLQAECRVAPNTPEDPGS